MRANGKTKARSAAKPRDMIQVRALAALKRCRARARTLGLDKLTMEEIDAEVRAVREERARLVKAAARALRAAGEVADERVLAGRRSAELRALASGARGPRR